MKKVSLLFLSTLLINFVQASQKHIATAVHKESPAMIIGIGVVLLLVVIIVLVRRQKRRFND